MHSRYHGTESPCGNNGNLPALRALAVTGRDRHLCDLGVA